MKDFEQWWATQNQTIGKVTAKAAWDQQQKIVDELEQRIKFAKCLIRGDFPGFVVDALDGIDMPNIDVINKVKKDV